MLYPHLATFLRIIASVCLLVYAFIFISSTMDDWKDNPIHTVIQLTNYPVQNIPFPALTVCPGEGNKPLRLGFVEAVFNFIRLQCDNSIEGDCNATEAARKAFAFVLDPFEEALRNGLAAKMGTDAHPYDEYTNAYVEDCLMTMVLNGNLSAAVGFIERWEKHYDTARIGQVNFQELGFTMQKAMKQEFSKMGMKIISMGRVECLNDTTPLVGCLAIIERWKKMYSMSEILYFPLRPTGTLFRTLVYLLGITSVTARMLSDVDMESSVNEGANRLLTKVVEPLFGHNRNATISVMDIPAIALPNNFDVELPYKTSLYLSTYPAYEYDGSLGEYDYQFDWEQYYARATEPAWKYGATPCVAGNYSHICRVFPDALQANITEALKILRFAQPHFRPDAELLLHSVQDLSFFMNGMDLLEADDNKVKQPQRTFVPSCGFALDAIMGRGVIKRDKSRCDQFESYWTDSGVCGAFNALPFGVAYNASAPSNHMFAEVYGVGDKNKTILNISGPGRVFSFSLTLDAHQLDADYLDLLRLPTGPPRDRSEFVVSIGNALNFFKVKAGNSIQVHGGEEVTLRITPSQLLADDDLKSIPVERRRCRFADELLEGTANLFSYYTQAACKFQCFIESAAEFCGCIPINYPKPVDAPMCDYMGANCFSTAMYGNGSQDADCGCLPDCQQVSYSYSLERKDIDADAACYDDPAKPITNLRVYIFDEIENYLSGIYITVEWFRKWTRDEDDERAAPFPSETPGWVFGDTRDASLCKLKVLKDIAIVNVEIATDTIIVSRNVEKSSFEEKLAYVGGTIGLFNGMSFITVVDLVILAIEYFGTSCRSKRRTKNNIADAKTNIKKQRMGREND